MTMATRAPRYSADEFARRGEAIYNRDVRPVLRPEDDNRFVAIDIESGNFEIDPDDYAAAERLLGRYPDAQIWLTRVGRQAAYRIGRGTGAGGAG
jgi:hypothetical protein